MLLDDVIEKLSDELYEKTGNLQYDGTIEISDSGNSFRLIIIPSPGRHTAPRQDVIDAVLKVVRDHFPSDCITTMEGTSDYPHGAYIITVSDYTRYHD